ncbi:MAG: hypothetical protein ACP5OA_03165, partial [Candidatus Woesearchaeota archaeon]
MDATSETLQKYIKGKGIDISKKSFVKSCSIKFHQEIDNYFSLKSKGIESFDYILCDDNVQSTKYYRILIKEVFYALKVGGYFIVQYTPKSLLLEDLEKELFFLMKNSIDIVQVYIEGQKCTVISKKLKQNPSKPEGINNWSFGIVTRGTTDPIVDDIIWNIREQKIPNYEIIVCGKYAGKYLRSKDVVYLEFMQKDEKGWTTRKKNLICERAKYDNLCVMHDRIKLHKGWFAGMKKYGNNWEILSMPTVKEGQRTYDWLTLKYPLEHLKGAWYLGSHLDYSDWDKWIYLDGGVITLKKYVWEKVHWDDSRYYNEAEDVKLSHDQTRYGFVARFNPYSTMESFRFNHPFSKIYIKKDPNKYG